jgi:gluconokinase
LNIHRCEWDTELLSYLPPSCVKALPPLQDITTKPFLGISKHRKDAHEITNPYWCQWPELREEEGCQLFLGVGDGAAATLGSKCTSSTTSPRIAVTIGTSAAIRLCRWYPRATAASENIINSENDTPLIIPDGLWCYRLTQEYVLIGGALTDGGSVIEFCRTLLNLKTDNEFTSCMEEVRTLMQQQDYHVHNRQIENDNNCVTNNTEIFLPFLGGERSVGFRLGATAALCGITHQTTPARFVHSCMEGVTLQLNEILTLLLKSREEEASNGTRTVLVVSGSALERNQLWRQMIANCTEMDVVMDSEVNECTSRGVAKLVAAILSSQRQQNKGPTTQSNLFPSLGEEEIMHPLDVCYPSPMTKANWSKKKYLQKELIQAVSKTWAPSFSDTSST